MSNYATKSEENRATDVYTSYFDEKAHFASLNLIVDELNINKLKFFATNLSKLNNVDNDSVQKILYIELVKKINAINLSK